MRPIDKFILHVIHNLVPLNEYNEGTMNKLMNKFKEEADDLNINISDEQLKKYIERFDILKNSPKIQEKELFKYSLGQLIKIVTSSPGTEIEDEKQEDDTPDVVYHEGDIIIWNGAKQGNCITYGEGERWCITRPGGSYWGNYRYGQGEPTFYLAKNNAISDSDKLSFVAIQVLNNGEYKFTNRNNSPGMEGPFSWSELNSRIPWLQEIPNARNVLKYIPLSNAEKANNVYKNRALTIRQWTQLPFNVKKQYLIARQGNRLFTDISDDEFITKYLPEYPQIATAVAEVPDLIDTELLLKNLDKFSNQDRKTITARIREKLRLDLLKTNIPFDVKKLLVALDKFNISSDERLYNSKDGKAIVKLNLKDGDIRISLFTEEDDYPNVKLNQRTSKYLLDYPELDKIPFETLLNLTSKNILSKDVFDQILTKAKNSPESTIVAKDTEDGTIIIDGNSLNAYRLQDGDISQIPFNDEEVQAIFNEKEDNQEFQKGVINNLFKDRKNIPDSVDRENLMSLINSTPYSDRTFTTSYSEIPLVFLTTDGNDPLIFTAFGSIQNVSGNNIPYTKSGWGYSGNWKSIRTNSMAMSDPELDAYFSYLQNQNQVFNDQQLLDMMKIDDFEFRSGGGRRKKYILDNPNLPLDQTNIYVPIENGGINYLINTQDPANSAKISNDSGKLIKANITSNAARRLLGARAPQAEPEAPAADQPAAQAPAAPQDGVRRRGRPEGVPNAPRQPQERQRGNVNVADAFIERGLFDGFQTLPRNDRRRLDVTDAVASPRVGDRGASARDNRLTGQGRVTNVVSIGKSKIYFIRLNNDTRIASINIQPGNREYVVANNRSYSLNSPRELLNFLQQRNILEALRKSMVKLYLQENPHMIDEIKKIKSSPEYTSPLGTFEPRRGRPNPKPNISRKLPIKNVDVPKVFVNKGLGKGFADLPMEDFVRLNVTNGSTLDRIGDRGASRRDLDLDKQGQVTDIISVDRSKIYFIKLDNANQDILASINIQPENRNYIVFSDKAYSLNSQSDLVNFLKDKDLLEALRTSLVKLHLQENPHMIEEMKNLKETYSTEESFKDYSNDALTDMIINLSRYEGNEKEIQGVKAELERRKQSKNMKLKEFKSLVREAVKKKLAENQPAPSRETKPGETETIPDRGTEEEKKRRRIGDPNKMPKKTPAKATVTMNENEKEVLKQIVDRFKQSRGK